MQESFLHYLWQMQYFNKKDLQTTDGEKIEVFNPGHLNTNAGPDFANARVKIGPMDWVGSVEVHTRSSEWFNHHHEADRAYDNVILHLVWQHDKEIIRTDKTKLSTLELRGRIDETLLRTYRQLIGSSFSIPCRRSLPGVPEITRVSMLEKAFMLRLERKADEVRALHHQNGNDWDETFYQLLARNFGFKINTDPFFQLARSLPMKILQKQAGSQTQIEALLFGQAGFLEARKGDEYYLLVKREYNLLSRKYNLAQSKMSKSQWRFLRLRPANFPSLRLAQLGAIIFHRQNLFSKILHANDVEELVSLFSASPSPYWMNHYQFLKKSKDKAYELGKASVESLIINTVVPVWAAYGIMMDDQQYMDRALRIVQQLPAELNKITRTWKDAGVDNCTSFDSQALIELYNNFCLRKGCLDCTIGNFLIRPNQ